MIRRQKLASPRAIEPRPKSDHRFMTADEDNTDPGSNPHAIEIRNLHFSRGSTQIFDGLSLNIRRGEVTAIMGPSGTGEKYPVGSVDRATRSSPGHDSYRG